jgi:hypothetical protein
VYQSFAPRYIVMDGGLVTLDGIREVMLMRWLKWGHDTQPDQGMIY